MSHSDPVRKIEGIWWVPERPDERVAGVATFDGSALLLRIFGSFSAVGFSGGRSAEVVLGESEGGGTSYALHGCFLKSERPGKETVIGAAHLFEGAAVGALDKPLWTSAYFQLDGLERWFRVWAFRFSMGAPEDTDGAVLLRRNAPKHVSVELSDCKISLRDVISETSYGSRRASFTAAAEFEITYPQPVSFSKAAGDCARLQLFVSLLANHVAAQRRLVLCMPGDDSLPVIVHYPSPYRRLVQEGGDENDIEDEVAAFDAIADVYANVLSEWWSRVDRVRLSMQLLLTTLGTSGLEANLLSVSQALEAYHRTTQPGIYMPPADYEQVRDAVVAAIPTGIPRDLQNSLVSRIHFGNEHSLRTRLRCLLDGLDERFKVEFLHDAGTFIDRLVRTRNALTHGLSTEDEARRWRGADMAYGTLRARWVLVARLLQDLGVPPARVWDIAQRNARFRFLRDRRDV